VTALNEDIRFVFCVNNAGYCASLELYKIYRLLPDKEAKENGEFRVVDESGEDYLYPIERFVLIELARAVEEPLL
jgi:hypothetical protein